MFQKNFFCPNIVPTITKVIWYIKNIRNIRMGQKRNGFMDSGEIPRKLVIGSAIYTANEPFIANTIKIISI
jgi:hypothetical protein